MKKQGREMHLGVFILGTGHHVGGWRMPGAVAGSENLQLMVQIAHSAERGKFDMVFLADTLVTSPTLHPSMVVRLEPLTLLAALSMATSHIGLAATASSTYTEPYNLARAFASLDHISGGRAAWNVVTTSLKDVAANFSANAHPPHDKRYEMAAEFVDVVKGLWDSWDDGAIVMDRESGQFLDQSRMHTLNHDGPFYKVRGPLNISRPPQGHPVIIQAGASDTGRDLAASIAEVVFSVQQDRDQSIAFVKDLRTRAMRAGRNPAYLKVMPGVCPIIGGTEAEARRKLRDLGEFLDPAAALRVLSDRLGSDLSDYPLDEPLPDLPESDGARGHAVTLMALARANGMTLRELRDYTSAALGHRVLIGTPEQVAQGLIDWFDAGAADGFNIMPPYFPGAFDEFVDEVVPLLQRHGKFRTEYTGTTLRDHLGLPRPRSTFADS